MRRGGGSISWSKIIRGSIASSMTDSAYQPNTALSPACSRATRSVAAQTQSGPVAYKHLPSVTDSLPRAAPNSVPIRRTIQEFAGNEMHKESVNMYQDWEEAYRAAVLETDHNRLIDK